MGDARTRPGLPRRHPPHPSRTSACDDAPRSCRPRGECHPDRRESWVVPGRVLGILAGGGGFDAGRTEIGHSAIDGPVVDYAEAEMMETGCVGVVIGSSLPCGPQRDSELSIVVVDVRLAVERLYLLAEAEDPHHTVVELLGSAQVADGEVQVVHSDDFDGHDPRLLGRTTSAARLRATLPAPTERSQSICATAEYRRRHRWERSRSSPARRSGDL